MPLPTPLAWWSHHIPTDFMTITTIYTNLTELVLSWFFFFPSRAVRIFLFHWVLYLELTIIFTGNYGFLNFLVSVLLLSLLDDKYLKKRSIFRLVIQMQKPMFSECTFFYIFFSLQIISRSGFILRSVYCCNLLRNWTFTLQTRYV